MLTPKQILTKYWGYDKFRPMQEDIIQSVLDGNDTLALLPTGGGKSLCYQVPALIMDGVCIVISPLIALMKDQVENLKKRGVNALAVNSAMSRTEIDVALDLAVDGKLKLLYVSPERLLTDLFRERVKRMKVSLLAVDESHCISQWGYDFRPPYLQIAAVRQYLPSVPVLALTATATPVVVKDIQEKLSFQKGKVFQKSFERKNLTYLVYHEENKLGRLLKIASSLKSTGVVYVRNRRKTREVAEFLVRNGISADYYHAGLDPATRDSKQNDWMSGRKKVIVSTNAFGMGIDKADVRFVVHLDLPDTLEAYFQEAGRAGRDEKQAWAVVLFEKADVDELRTFTEQSFPPLETIRKVYSSLGNYLNLAVGSGKDQSFDFDIQQFCANYKFQAITVFNALRLLEKEGYLSLSDAMHRPSSVFVRMNKDELYRFQVGHKNLDPFIKLLLRSYSGIFNGFVKISEKELSRRAVIREDDCVKLLRQLHQLEVIHYVPASDQPRLTWTMERMDEKHVYLSPQVYRDRKASAIERMESVVAYVNSNAKCRSQQLLTYFGEQDGPRCGNCDVCKKRNEVSLSEVEFDRILEQLKPLLKEHALSLGDIISQIRGFPDKKVLDVLNWMIDNDKIILDREGHYYWRKH